jgi:hypothetical protein
MQGPSLAKDFWFISAIFDKLFSANSIPSKEIRETARSEQYFFKIFLVYPWGHNYTLNDLTEKVNYIYVQGIGQ